MVAEVADDTEVVARATRRVETVVTASSAATTAATAVECSVTIPCAITVVEVTGNTVDTVASSDMAAATTGATTMV